MTINYYNQNADNYFERTVNIDMDKFHKRFLSYLPAGGILLDAGCGSGRDAKAFQDLGYKVDAIDASGELAKRASQLLGKQVLCRRFDEITAKETYDGIWTSATLLHVSDDQMLNSMRPIFNSLKSNGIWYISFKYGCEAKIERGILYNHQTEGSLKIHLNKLPKLKIVEMWKETYQDSSCTQIDWLCCLVTKT